MLLFYGRNLQEKHALGSRGRETAAQRKGRPTEDVREKGQNEEERNAQKQEQRATATLLSRRDGRQVATAGFGWWEKIRKPRSGKSRKRKPGR